MTDPEVYLFNQQIPSVTGFLGGITFTAMVLLMQSASEIKFSDWLIPATAFVSFLFIITTLTTLIDPKLHRGVGKKHFTINLIFIQMGFVGLLVLIPLIVSSFSLVGSIIIGVLEVICYVIINKYFQPIPIENDEKKDLD